MRGADVSKLDELIEKLCPDGVEYRALREIALMKRGTSITKKNVNEGSYPVVSGGREPAYYCAMFNRQGETITVAGSGAGAGYVQYWDTPIFVCDAFSVNGTSLISTKFLYYLLTNKQEAIYSTKKGGGVPHVHISDIENFRIPVPPLEVQAEIVRILDRFTELEKDMLFELELRRKQYEYYRDLLLDFRDVHAGGTNAYSVPWLADMLHELCPDGVEYKALGEFANISRGKIMSKDYLKENIGEYPVYSSQTENNGQMGSISTYMYDGEYLTWTTDGANAGTVFFRSGKFSITNVCGLIDVKNRYKYEIFSYYFKFYYLYVCKSCW